MSPQSRTLCHRSIGFSLAASLLMVGCGSSPASSSDSNGPGGKADRAGGRIIDTRASVVGNLVTRLHRRFTGSPVKFPVARPKDAPPAGNGAGANGPFPAFNVSLPQAVSYGGPVLKAPRITTITFGNDVHRGDVAAGAPSVELIETFDQVLGFNPGFWGAIAEYGVGPGGTTGPIRLTETAPALIDDSAVSVDPSSGQLVKSLQAWLLDKLDGTHPEFGTPDDNTLYAIYYPVGTTVMLGQAASCKSFGAYHSSVVLPASDRYPQGQNVAYAVMPRCTSQQNPAGDMHEVTLAASHEFAEAATDPYPFVAPAYFQVDANHIAFEILSGAEIGDLCEFEAPVTYALPDRTFVAQRLWSNAAAKAGLDPCVPNAQGYPYFNTSPVMNETLDLGDGFTTLGSKIAVGQSKTIELDLLSSAKTSGPFTVTTFDIAQGQGGDPEFTFCLSNTPPTGDATQDGTCNQAMSGVNGDKVYLTITVKAQGQQLGLPGLIALPIQSTLGADQTHWWFGLIQN